MEKKQFRFNLAAQKMYDVNLETYSFETIEKQDANSRFVRIFLLTTLRDAVTRVGSAVLQLPQRETAHEINFRLEPLKNNKEKVIYAFIFISLADNNAAHENTGNDLVSKTE
jgi:hypothetical protein